MCRLARSGVGAGPREYIVSLSDLLLPRKFPRRWMKLDAVNLRGHVDKATSLFRSSHSAL